MIFNILSRIFGRRAAVSSSNMAASRPARTMDEQEIEALMEQYREPAIMLYRPYPPNDLPKTNSWLGGLPALPAGTEWPRNNYDVPLHFLAQIDCSELPSTDSILPDTGVLFFFARIDEEMSWLWDGDPRDGCSVIHAPAGDVLVPAPGDLPPIMGEYAAYERDFKLPGDTPFNVYPRWPVATVPIQSWPDDSALPYDPRDYSPYHKAVVEARVAEFERIAGKPDPIPDSRPSLLPTEQTPSFPQCWVMVDRIARRLANSVQDSIDVKSRTDPEWSSGEEITRFQAVYDASVKWVEAAADKGLAAAPSDETKGQFSEWLSGLASKTPGLSHSVSLAIESGMLSAIQLAANSPEIASAIPEAYYTEFEHRNWRRKSTYHQMLGNAGSSQEAAPVERDEILLLYLMSDYAVDFMFCDVGEIEFWIKKDDLAARRFDRVRPATAGG